MHQRLRITRTKFSTVEFYRYVNCFPLQLRRCNVLMVRIRRKVHFFFRQTALNYLWNEKNFQIPFPIIVFFGLSFFEIIQIYKKPIWRRRHILRSRHWWNLKKCLGINEIGSKVQSLFCVRRQPRVHVAYSNCRQVPDANSPSSTAELEIQVRTEVPLFCSTCI